MPTNLKKKDVIFAVCSKGGILLYSDENYVPAKTVDSIVTQSCTCFVIRGTDLPGKDNCTFWLEIHVVDRINN